MTVKQTSRRDTTPPRRKIALLRRGLLVAAVSIAVSASAAKFTASVDRETILLGETVTLTLSFEGAAPSSMPQLPAIPGLQVAGGMNYSTTSSAGPEGQMHTVTRFSVPLAATRTGEIQIPALQIALAGQKTSSAPLRLQVLAEDPTAPPAEFGQRSAFLWLVLPKKAFYLGETFVAELRLYIRPGVRNINGFEPPPLQTEGLTAGRWVSGSYYTRRVGNRQFTVVPMTCAARAVKTGPLKTGNLNASVILNPPDIFESVWGRRADTEQVALSLAPQEFQVLPLPGEEVPSGFNGAVGNFTLSVSAGPTNVATGDPITIKIQISGRGSLETVNLPAQIGWDGFKSYPPTSNIETTDALGIQGTKTFEQVVSAESVSIKEIPPLAFSFFDPEKREYRTLTQPAIALTVRPGGATVMPVIAAGNNTPSTSPPPAQDIVHIKPRPGRFTAISPPWIQQPWFLAAQTVPVLAWLAAIGFRKRADALENNPRLRRRRQVMRLLRDGMPELQRHATANDSDAFFATLVRLLQEQLGERLDCPASAITEAVIDEKLRPRGLPENTLTELHDLFQTCNLARYAPIKSSQQLAAFVPRFEAVVRELQNLKP